MSTPNHVKTSVDAFELIMNGAIESLRRDIAGAVWNLTMSQKTERKAKKQYAPQQADLSKARAPRDEKAQTEIIFGSQRSLGSYDIKHVNSLDWLAQAEPNSIHAVVTDPPYVASRRNGSGDSAPAACSRRQHARRGSRFNQPIPQKLRSTQNLRTLAE